MDFVAGFAAELEKIAFSVRYENKVHREESRAKKKLDDQELAYLRHNGAGPLYDKDVQKKFPRPMKKRADEQKPSAFKKFVNSESGAMFAEHLPFGGAMLGAARGQKSAPGGRLRNAAKGVLGSTIGNVAGATAGLGAGALISHALKAHGHKVPGWVMPTAIGAGGLLVAPAVVHKFTHT